jgi:hypothetical protein
MPSPFVFFNLARHDVTKLSPVREKRGDKDQLGYISWQAIFQTLKIELPRKAITPRDIFFAAGRQTGSPAYFLDCTSVAVKPRRSSLLRQ